MQDSSYCGRLDRHAGNLSETATRLMIFNTNTNNEFA